MDSEQISMVQDCIDIYRVIEKPDGSAEIIIHIPARFKNLWLVRLSDLRTTEQEIKAYEDERE